MQPGCGTKEEQQKQAKKAKVHKLPYVKVQPLAAIWGVHLLFALAGGQQLHLRSQRQAHLYNELGDSWAESKKLQRSQHKLACPD